MENETKYNQEHESVLYNQERQRKICYTEGEAENAGRVFSSTGRAADSF